MEVEERAAHAKAIKVIGGHKAQITRAMVVLSKAVADGSIPENDLPTIKSAKSMVEKQIQKIESQVDSLLGVKHPY